MKRLPELTPADSLRMMAPPTEEQLDELEAFLLSDATSDEVMMLEMLDGYLTAIASGPVEVAGNEWMPGVWGPTAEDVPDFESEDQAARIVETIVRQYNGIVWSLHHDPDTFDPSFETTVYADDPHPYLDGEMWAYGYMKGVALRQTAWQPLFDDPGMQEVLRPIWLLGADDPQGELDEATRTPAQREALTLQIPAAVAAIYRYWLPTRQAVMEREVATTLERTHPKVGRNDPCPCGGGKKFKKCCGAAAQLH